MNDSDLFQKLCHSQIEGNATDDERQQLADLLNASEEARQAYVEQMRVHALLTWQHGRSGTTAPVLPENPKIVRFPWRRRILAVAALLILSTVAAWWALDSKRPVAFEVTATRGTSFRVGERASRRMLELGRGQLSFRLDSGAVVDIDGPVKLELIDAMRLRVLRGTVTADISDGQKGFIVETAETQVVDLGTRFSVATDTDHGTDVVVFEGEVEVFDPSGKVTKERPKITLTEGEAIRVRTSKRPDRLRMVPLRPDARSIETGPASDIVTGIEDNVSGHEFRGYYGLVRGSFGEGARAYTTGHSRTWRPMPGGTFPEEMLGADGICTFDTDRNRPDLIVTLQVSRPCVVYVMADARREPPAWLKKDFADTGFRLRSGPWIPRTVAKEDHPKFYDNPANYVPHMVWKRRIEAPGPVVLGPVLPGSRAMYGIAVKRLP